MSSDVCCLSATTVRLYHLLPMGDSGAELPLAHMCPCKTDESGRLIVALSLHLPSLRELRTSQRGAEGHHQEDLEADQHETAGPGGAPCRW
jgi:hypothetical protein